MYVMRMNTGGTAAERLRDWRVNAQMTQMQFATKTGTRPDMISLIETGKRRPTLELAVAIERVTEGAITAAAWVPASKSEAA